MAIPLIIGHRGAKGIAPENTLKAFKVGLDFADCVECDVHLTKDKKIVVIHDGNIKRTSNGEGEVSQMTFEEIRNFNFGDDQKISLLSEVFDLVKDKNKKIIIDIKGDSFLDAKDISVAVGNFLKENDKNEIAFVSSIWEEAILEIKIIKPQTKTFIILDMELTAEDILNKLKKSKADGISIVYTFVDKKIITALHSQNYLVNVWPVNEPEDILNVSFLGVDGVITDYPETALKYLKKE